MFFSPHLFYLELLCFRACCYEHTRNERFCVEPVCYHLAYAKTLHYSKQSLMVFCYPRF